MSRHIKFNMYICYERTYRLLRDVFKSQMTKYFNGKKILGYVPPMTDKLNINTVI